MSDAEEGLRHSDPYDAAVLPYAYDINNDLSLNILDLQVLVTAILAEETAPGTFPDTNGDSVVNLLDLSALIAELQTYL